MILYIDTCSYALSDDREVGLMQSVCRCATPFASAYKNRPPIHRQHCSACATAAIGVLAHGTFTIVSPQAGLC